MFFTNLFFCCQLLQFWMCSTLKIAYILSDDNKLATDDTSSYFWNLKKNTIYTPTYMKKKQ